MNASECSGGAQAGRFRPERHNRKSCVPGPLGTTFPSGHREHETSGCGARAGPSGLGPTRAFTRIHAGAPAQLGRPPLRRPYRGPKRKKARGGD
ncbi:hypothetical protein NDU88_004320 [Pleurodeles waltl]|uniref:Uncharacterized protein n=1 Tax=Pleurodeles waltl TaxID=8319 RepID=A0AAV7SIF3_PLEWA|nr:hypothetical protein NDU88_004320 [Pleurodeles waltl]